MTRFRIRAKDFKKFINTVSCKGTLQFKSKGRTEANLFSSFFIDVDKDNQKLTVLTVDTFFNQIKQVSKIGANILEEGVLEITEKKAFDTILSSMAPESIVEIYSDGTSIYLENSEGDWYKRRIVGDKGLDAVFDKKDKLFEWNKSHTLEEVLNDDEKTVEVWKITIAQGSALYPMRIKTTKKNLGKFVQDAVKLTRDNDTVIISENEEIQVWSGKPNSSNQSKHSLTFENIGKTLIDFKVKFSALQAIVPNLLDDVILNFRKTGEQTIIMRIESFDKNMHQIISLGSQDRDGILYDIEEEVIENDTEEIPE